MLHQSKNKSSFYLALDRSDILLARIQACLGVDLDAEEKYALQSCRPDIQQKINNFIPEPEIITALLFRVIAYEKTELALAVLEKIKPHLITNNTLRVGWVKDIQSFISLCVFLNNAPITKELLTIYHGAISQELELPELDLRDAYIAATENNLTALTSLTIQQQCELIDFALRKKNYIAAYVLNSVASKADVIAHTLRQRYTETATFIFIANNINPYQLCFTWQRNAELTQLILNYCGAEGYWFHFIKQRYFALLKEDETFFINQAKRDTVIFKAAVKCVQEYYFDPALELVLAYPDDTPFSQRLQTPFLDEHKKTASELNRIFQQFLIPARVGDKPSHNSLSNDLWLNIFSMAYGNDWKIQDCELRQLNKQLYLLASVGSVTSGQDGVDDFQYGIQLQIEQRTKKLAELDEKLNATIRLRQTYSRLLYDLNFKKSSLLDRITRKGLAISLTLCGLLTGNLFCLVKSSNQATQITFSILLIMLLMQLKQHYKNIAKDDFDLLLSQCPSDVIKQALDLKFDMRLRKNQAENLIFSRIASTNMKLLHQRNHIKTQNTILQIYHRQNYTPALFQASQDLSNSIEIPRRCAPRDDSGFGLDLENKETIIEIREEKSDSPIRRANLQSADAHASLLEPEEASSQSSSIYGRIRCVIL